ncbi:MAG: transposase [Candidatus Sumerlaeaceae bacterium]
MARIVVAGCPHHITHRSNLRADIFLHDNDRLLYKSLLAQTSRPFGLQIWAYCLLTNHIHLIAVINYSIESDPNSARIPGNLHS